MPEKKQKKVSLGIRATPADHKILHQAALDEGIKVQQFIERAWRERLEGRKGVLAVPQENPYLLTKEELEWIHIFRAIDRAVLDRELRIVVESAKNTLKAAAKLGTRPK